MTDFQQIFSSPSVSGGLFFRVKSFLKHWFGAKTVHSVHSPFVYRFYQEVIKGGLSHAGAEIEVYRRSLLHDQRSLEWLDMGAGPGSKGGGTRSAKIAYLAGVSSRNRKEGEIILRLAGFQQANHMLELGTHLGISAMYLQAGAPLAQIDTIEGGESLADFVKESFESRGLPICVHTGDFDKVLNRLNFAPESLDLVFLDGNHRSEPLLRYARRLIPALKPGGVLVVDDLYWSPDMAKGWQALIALPEITVSIDLYHLGVCIVNRPQAKEHFLLRA